MILTFEGLATDLSSESSSATLGLAPTFPCAGLICFATLLYNLPDHYLHLANFVLQQLDALKGHYGG